MANGDNRSGKPPVIAPVKLGDGATPTEEFPAVAPTTPALPVVTAPLVPAIPRVTAPGVVPAGTPRIAPAVVAPAGAPRITGPGAVGPVIAPPGAPRSQAAQLTAPAPRVSVPVAPPGAPRAVIVPPGAPRTAPLTAPVSPPPAPPGPSRVAQPIAPVFPGSAPAPGPFTGSTGSQIARPVVSSSPSSLGSAPPRANVPGAALPARRPGPLPESGSIEAVNALQAGQLAVLADGLDKQDYFQVLQVTQAAAAGDIKRAFYRESRVYHPDRFFHLSDELAKESIGAIYRRITEAYYVLRDDAKRKKYLADINGPERAAKLRFNEASEAEQKAEAKKVAEEEFGNNPKSRQFFKAALTDIASQNWAAAERNLKMGLTYEPGNAKCKEKLVEVQRKIEEVRKASGDSFKIK